MKLKLKLMLLVTVLATAICISCSDKENDSPESITDEGNLTAIVGELEKNGAFANFARLLAAVEESGDADGYTVFAVPDSITARQGSELSKEDIAWHIVAGKHTPEEWFGPQTTASYSPTPTAIDGPQKAIYGPGSIMLRTIGGHPLNVVSETVIIDGEEQSLIYINGIPLHPDEQMLVGNSIVYPTGANIASVSVAPDTTDTKAYNNWLAMMMEGVWAVTSLVEKDWALSSRGVTVGDTTVHSYVFNGYREIFRRDATYAAANIAGQYESVHPGGDLLIFGNGGYGGGSRHETGWWSISSEGFFFHSITPGDYVVPTYPYLKHNGGLYFDAEAGSGRVMIVGKIRETQENPACRMGLGEITHICTYVNEKTYTLWKIATF